MPINQKLPKLFNEVLDAIAILREKNGSSEQSILRQVETILTLRGQRFTKKGKASIYQALRFGLKTGMLKLRYAKYCLGISKDQYNKFRKVNRSRIPNDLLREIESKRERTGRKTKRTRRSWRQFVRKDSTESSDYVGTSHNRRNIKRSVKEEVKQDHKKSAADDKKTESNEQKSENVAKDAPSKVSLKTIKSETQDHNVEETNSVNNIDDDSDIQSNQSEQDQTDDDYKSEVNDNQSQLSKGSEPDKDKDCGDPNCLCNSNPFFK